MIRTLHRGIRKTLSAKSKKNGKKVKLQSYHLKQDDVNSAQKITGLPPPIKKITIIISLSSLLCTVF